MPFQGLCSLQSLHPNQVMQRQNMMKPKQNMMIEMTELQHIQLQNMAFRQQNNRDPETKPIPKATLLPPRPR
eukprot:5922048-Amphidinium_carterae.1